VMKSSLTEAAARSWRARKIPESPPERNSEMKPSAKSMAVLSCTRAFQSVPSQLISRIVAGNPSEEASSEKTSGENGFMPLENMCCPQTQKTENAHAAQRQNDEVLLPHRFARKRGNQMGDEAETRQHGNVDFRLREKPKEPLPENGNGVRNDTRRLNWQ